MLLDLLVGLIELKLPITVRLLALVDEPSMLFQLGGQTLQRFGFSRRGFGSLRPSFCSAAVRSAVIGLDLVGHLLQLLFGILLPLAGRLQRRAGLHEIVFKLLFFLRGRLKFLPFSRPAHSAGGQDQPQRLRAGIARLHAWRRSLPPACDACDIRAGRR